jgi:hypothetical protein
VNPSPTRGRSKRFPASVRSAETRRHLKGPTGGRRRRWRGTKRRNHRGEEVVVEADVVPSLLARESKMIVPARRAETARGNRAGGEPERCRGVCVDLACLYLRNPRFARRVGLSFRLARHLSATDDVTTVGGRLREGGQVGRDDRRGERRGIRIGIEEGASAGGPVTEIQGPAGRSPFLNRIGHSHRRHGDQSERHGRYKPIHAPRVRPRHAGVKPEPDTS